MFPFNLISIITSVSCIFMGNFIYYKNPNNRLNQVLAIFSFLVAYMTFTDFQISSSTTPEQAYWWMKAAFPWVLMGSFYVHLALLSTEKFHILKKKITYVLIYLPTILLAIINLTTNLISHGAQKGYWGWTYMPNTSILTFLAIIWTILLWLISAILVLHYYFNSAGTKRRQAKYILIGIYSPLFLAILLEFVMPIFFSIPALVMFNLYIALGLGFIVYGIWKFRLPQLTSSIVSDKILSKMSNFLFLLDEDGKIIHVNPKAIEISGYTEKELIGKPVDFVFNEIDYPDSHLSNKNNMKTTLKRKDDNCLPVLVSTSPIKTAKQDVLGLIIVGNDISPLIKAEKERDHYKEHLDELVEERTKELENMNIQLKKEIIAHEEAENKLKNSLDEKEILVKEIHHRVKNNLMIISSLLNLQAQKIKDEKVQNVFKESQNRAKSMAIIHERLYQTKSMRKIEFDDYIRQLSTELFHTYRLGSGIHLNMDLDPVEIDVDHAIPLGLIINELITNSLKYAFPDGKGELCIEFHCLPGEDEFELVVSDDGVGFPADLDFRKVDSLGLQLVNNLTKQLDGTIELDRSRGTKFTIKFKTPKYSK